MERNHGLYTYEIFVSKTNVQRLAMCTGWAWKLHLESVLKFWWRRGKPIMRWFDAMDDSRKLRRENDVKKGSVGKRQMEDPFQAWFSHLYSMYSKLHPESVCSQSLTAKEEWETWKSTGLTPWEEIWSCGMNTAWRRKTIDRVRWRTLVEKV